MPPKKDFDDVDLTEKLLKSFDDDEESSVDSDMPSLEDGSSSPDVVCISEPCKGFSRKNKDIVWISGSACQDFSKLPKKTKSGRSWASCLCKCVMITTLVVFLLTAIATAFCYVWVKDVVQHLTIQGHHRSFPIVEMSDAEIDVVKDSVKLFVDELRKGDSSMPLDDLVITQDEINGLLCHSDYLRGNMQVTLSKDSILEEYSLPMDMMPGGKGRYFDGHDSTKVMPNKNRLHLEMETTALHKDWFVGPLYLLELSYNVNDSNEYHQRLLELFLENGSTIFGQAIPDDVIRDHTNLLDGAYSDPDSGFDVRNVVGGIHAVKIMDGKIVVHPRRGSLHWDSEEEEEDIHVVPRAPVFSDETDDMVDPAGMLDNEEPVSTATPEEPITVELIALEESFDGDTGSMDDADYGDDVEDTHQAKETAIAAHAAAEPSKDSTFLRANKVRAAAPVKAASATSTTTSLRNAKSNP